MDFFKNHILFFLIPMCFFTTGFVSEAKTTPVTRTYELSSDTHLVQVQVQTANVTIIPAKKTTAKNQPDTRQLKIQYITKKDFRTSSTDNIFKISEKDFPSFHSEEQTAVDKKQFNLTIWLPPQLSLRILAVSGRVEIKDIKPPNLSISMLSKGSIQIKNTEGHLNIFQESGTVRLSAHKGDLKIHAENSKLKLDNCHGNMEVRSFKGRLSVQKSSGELSIHTFKTPVTLSHFTGQLTSRQEKGGLYLKPMTGSIKAYSAEAEIQGQLYPDKVSIETKKGAISLDLPGSRAWLSMESWEGRIKAPLYFYRVRTGGLHRARGRLRGKGKNKGDVALKSHSGSIRVYQSSN